MYDRLISAALAQPWALSSDMMAVVWDILRFRASGGRLTAEELAARIGPVAASDRPQTMRTGGAVAVIPIYGVIANRTFEASSGMTSAERVGGMLSAALAATEVGGIVLDVASPGGSVDGIQELAAAIHAARKEKPITASVNALAASAGYWLASQADEIVITPSGMAGSIGVYSLHEDWSAALEQQGVKITAIQAGDRKLEGAPWLPLDDDAKAHFQAQVDAAYRQFIADVARGRGVSQAAAKASSGGGRLFDAKEAVKIGLVDRIGTLDQAIAEMSATVTKRAGRRAEGERVIPLAAVTPVEPTTVTVHLDTDRITNAAKAEVIRQLAAQLPVNVPRAASDKDARDLAIAIVEAQAG